MRLPFPDSPEYAETVPRHLANCRHAAAQRARACPLPADPVQRTIDELVDGGAFDELLSGLGDPGSAQLHRRLADEATARLLAEGRAPEDEPVVRRYVRWDLWSRFPVLAAPYRDQVEALGEVWDFGRVLDRGDPRGGEAFRHRVRGWFGIDDSAIPDVPNEVTVRRYEHHVLVTFSNYVRERPFGWRTRWAALRSDDSLVELDLGALAPEFVRPDLLGDLRELARLYRDWIREREREAYNLGMERGHLGIEPFPEARR